MLYPLIIKSQRAKSRLLGEKLLGTVYSLNTYSPGSRCNICGEETALLESIEGRRGQPGCDPLPGNGGFVRQTDRGQ